jgi:hypothetical protein
MEENFASVRLVRSTTRTVLVATTREVRVSTPTAAAPSTGTSRITRHAGNIDALGGDLASTSVSEAQTANKQSKAAGILLYLQLATKESSSIKTQSSSNTPGIGKLDVRETFVSKHVSFFFSVVKERVLCIHTLSKVQQTPDRCSWCRWDRSPGSACGGPLSSRRSGRC